MRTLEALEKWVICSWPCRAVFERSGRHYDVSGAIAFELLFHSTEPDLAAMAKAIRDIDYWYPWMDMDATPSSGEYKSIFHLSDGHVVTHNFNTPLKIVWFSIHPMSGHMKKSQVYAYEKYLAKLAKELAKQFAGAVTEVRSVIEVRASTSFKA